MKTCPKCGRTYEDETLNFCLEDGTVLNRSEAQSSQEPPPTVMMPSSPLPTSDRPPVHTAEQTLEVSPVPQYTMPKKKSHGWIWALVILFVAIVLCGGGFVGLMLIGALSDGGSSVTETNSVYNGYTPTPGEDAGEVVATDDMSDWPRVLSSFEGLEVTYSAGELYANTRKNYFYVISTGSKFKTADSAVSVRVRNPSGRAASFGYGLVVNSDPEQVLKHDFGFLIRSDTQEYKVVQHENKIESVVVDWTYSDAIKQGTRANELQVRCNGNEMSFYVNGQFIKSVTDYSNYTDGVAGIYTSDDVPIAFSKLELRR